MNAVEFFKKYGAIDSKKSIERSPPNGVCTIYTSGYGFERCNRDDLKQIVEAFEFVDAHRSIDIAKKYISTMDADGTSKHYDKLRTFINLVEQCQ